MNKTSGDFDKEGLATTKDSERATEIVHLRHYSARSPYGLPRYIGNLLGIFGDRAAEEINYTTFKNNNIPSMAVMVSNGQLTEGTIQRIESFVESQIRSSDNYSKFLIIEAEPVDEEGEDGGQLKIEIKPLTSDQHKDALFQQYSKNNQDKIRRAFRLPPIFVGRSDDYSRSTAESSRRLADEQVFSPERDRFDDVVNRTIFPCMGIRFHRFKSNSPNTTDNESLVKILAGAEKTGGMTPRIARAMLEQILGIDLPEFPGAFPQDVPFSLTMAEAVKNKADVAEPGQQVTALKAIAALTDSDIQFADDAKILEVAKQLLSLNQAAEMMWRKSLGSEEG
jgi:capsid portal protein